MEDKLRKEVNAISGVHPDWGPLTSFKKGFIEGAKWQRENMWTSVEEGLPEDGIENPKFGQEIKCLGYYDGDVFPCTRFYEIEGDYEDIGFAWIWDDGEPEYWMYKPEFKN